MKKIIRILNAIGIPLVFAGIPFLLFGFLKTNINSMIVFIFLTGPGMILWFIASHFQKKMDKEEWRMYRLIQRIGTDY